MADLARDTVIQDARSAAAQVTPEARAAALAADSSQPLFGRTVEVTLSREGERGRRLSGLHVSYTVDHDDASSPSKAKIEIAGVSDDTVAIAQDKRAIVSLRIGYGTPLQVFTGTPTPGGVRDERQDDRTRVLSIEAEDGGRSYRTGRVRLSLAAEQSIGDLVGHALDALGLPVGRVQLPDPGIRIPAPVVLAGTARDVLDRLALTAGCVWFVRDGHAYVIPRGAHTGERAVLFSSRTGNLIGEPVVRDGGVEVRSLTEPSMRPRKLFAVEAARVSGQFIARSVRFEGDEGETEGSGFYTITFGVPA